jgi:hypothetical protein
VEKSNDMNDNKEPSSKNFKKFIEKIEPNRPYCLSSNNKFVEEFEDSYDISDYNEWRNENRKYSLYDDPSIAIDLRDESIEQKIWDKAIQPLIDQYYNNRIQYKFISEPKKITKGALNLMWRKMRCLCLCEFDLIFPTDDFEEEVMGRLAAGLTIFSENKKCGPVNLKEIFYTFLKDVINAKTLPIFLANLRCEYVAGISLDDVLKRFESDIESFYMTLKDILKKEGIKGGPASATGNHLMKTFNKTKDNFNYLKIEHINPDFQGGNNFPRDIMGPILTEMVKDLYTNIYYKSPNAGNFQYLFNRYSKVRKNSD